MTDNELFATDDFSELVLKHLIRDKEVFATAKRANLTGEELSNSTAGLAIYKAMANIAFEIGFAPISRDVFLPHVKQQMQEGKPLSIYSLTQISELCDWIFDNGELNPAYICPKLYDFVKFRKLTRSRQSCENDLFGMQEKFLEIEKEHIQNKVASQLRSSKPFESIVRHKTVQGITFGFKMFDEKFGGIASEECGLLVGMSGSGKTAVASALSFNAGARGRRVLYVSAEEPMENIVSRWYANAFDISYNDLHRGQAEFEKEQAFNAMDSLDQRILSNIQVVDVRGLAPVTKDVLVEVVEKKAQEGFVPELVVVDQMDYIKPKAQGKKTSGKWEDYETVAFELDEFSQHKIANEANFGLVVVHQGKGAPKWEFTYDDIAGFRGIVKPFDWAIGVGRRSRVSPRIQLFSMKVRHSEQFNCKFLADFEHMRFEEDHFHEDDPEGDEAELIKEGAKMREKKKRKRNPLANDSVTASSASNPIT